jgi:hypothetical protein
MQTSFTDSMGRIWAIDSPIDYPTIHRVRSMASIDLLSITRGVVPLPATDRARTVLALWAIVKPNAEFAGITPTDFTTAMQEPELQAAAIAAVIEALAPLVPST